MFASRSRDGATEQERDIKERERERESEGWKMSQRRHGDSVISDNYGLMRLAAATYVPRFQPPRKIAAN